MSLLESIKSGADRFLGAKSKPCGACGSPRAYVNAMGGISCWFCLPPKSESEVRLPLVSVTPPGSRHSVWERWGGDTATSEAQAGRGAGGSDVAGVAGVAGQVAETSRPDPLNTSMAIYVSCGLDYFLEPLPSTKAITFTRSDAMTNWQPVAFRRLDQGFFGWINQQVAALFGKIPESDFAELAARRSKIVALAVSERIFGNWADDEFNWPVYGPPGFRRPEAWGWPEPGAPRRECVVVGLLRYDPDDLAGELTRTDADVWRDMGMQVIENWGVFPGSARIEKPAMHEQPKAWRGKRMRSVKKKAGGRPDDRVETAAGDEDFGLVDE